MSITVLNGKSQLVTQSQSLFFFFFVKHHVRKVYNPFFELKDPCSCLANYLIALKKRPTALNGQGSKWQITANLETLLRGAAWGLHQVFLAINNQQR